VTNRWPFRAESVRNGCTCRWWGEASIVDFDTDCPILQHHRAGSESMPNNNYARGAAFERKVKEFLESRGFFAGRSAGSHGLVDVFALTPRHGTPVLIQCKTGKAKMSEADRKALRDLADDYQADAFVASPGPNGAIDFYHISWNGSLDEMIDYFKES